MLPCTSDNDDAPVDELAGLTKFKEISNTTHTIELYKHMGGLEQGFNEIALKIKDKTSNQYITNATVSWMPVMHMTMMNHSCPKSPVTKVSTDGAVYEGYIVFQMAQNATEYWDLKIDYTINGTAYTVTSVIDVPASAKQRVTTFTGSDGVKYIAAFVDPHHPKVGINDISCRCLENAGHDDFSGCGQLQIENRPKNAEHGQSQFSQQCGLDANNCR